MRSPVLSGIAVGVSVLLAATAALAHAGGATASRLYRPAPNPAAVDQVRNLAKEKRFKDALLVGAMAMQPHAVWVTGGTPAEVEQQVRKTMMNAALQHAVPVLAAYNLPYRDCGQYSAGGAAATAEYLAWIEGLARGIGQGRAIVVLEPDGLGIIPYNVDLQGTLEWCQPTLPPDATPDVLNEARYAQLNAAVDRLSQLPNVNTYLDATHVGWLSVGEAAFRLVKAGIARTQGFFLNVSNYQATEQLQKYGTWISKCIWFATESKSWGFDHFDSCASQYYPATASDPSTFSLTDQWYSENVESQTLAPYPGNDALTHFVVDTSRNGQGPWTPAADAYSGDAETWCNPPDRGLGLRPTLHTGVSLIDAYLWIKVPGESDGSCTRSTGGTVDPEWGVVDPAAGAWFPEQALELAHLADPVLF